MRGSELIARSILVWCCAGRTVRAVSICGISSLAGVADATIRISVRWVCKLPKLHREAELCYAGLEADLYALAGATPA